MRIAIIGAGPAGLAAGYDLARAGQQVTLFEGAPNVGGLAAGLCFDSLAERRARIALTISSGVSRLVRPGRSRDASAIVDLSAPTASRAAVSRRRREMNR